ncbi:MlaD family protein [Actinocorallia longicatena]|uniref:MCE family protein n=1 Tax=Actinocorallia longicatena TaxID=111803 RepID=A0ABP6PY02_9ACTN
MALKSFRDRPPILVGLVSLAVIAVVIGATFLTGTMGLLKSRYEMSGVFTDTGNLRNGNDVLVAGVRVGQITSVEPDFKKGEVLVKWKVDTGIDLGPSTRAEIRMANILGGRFLRLSGPVTKPYMEDVPKSQRRIPVDRTKVPTTVNEVLKEGTKALQGLDTKTFSKVLDQLAAFTPEDRDKIAHAFSQVTKLADEFSDTDGKVTELLDNSDKVLKIVSDKDAKLSELVNNAMTLIDQLKERRAYLTTLLGGGGEAVQSLTKLITTKQKALNDIIADLDHTLKTIDPNIAQLNTALAWAGPSLQSFAGIADQGNYLDTIFSQMGQLSPSDLGKLAEQLGGKK